MAFQTLDCPVCEAKPDPVIPTACKHGPVSEPSDPPLPPRPAPNAPPIAVETYKRAVLEARFQTQGARLGDANDLLRDCKQGLEEQGL